MNTNQQVAPIEPNEVSTASEAGSIMAVIARAASDPNVNVEKIERLAALYERIKAAEAKTAYMAALSAMQPDLPVIERKGKITIRAKVDGERTGAVQQATAYALWEDINEAISPVLKTHGFALSFRTGTAIDGKLTVTGILSHRGGHQEETTLSLMHDSTGSKNSVQAIGSSLSYGKRYTAGALLNITSRGEDDDGLSGGASYITDEQASTIQNMLAEVQADLSMFLKFVEAESVDKIPAKNFDKAMQALGARKANLATKKAKVST